MKSIRVGYTILTALFFLLARYTGRREFFLLFFMLAIVAAYAALLNLWTVFSFSFLQKCPVTTAVKGTTQQLRVEIHNGKPFPFNRMRIRVETALPSEEYVLGFNLPPSGRIQYEIPLHCAYRGVYKVGMTTLEVNDIFGLVRVNYDLRALPYYRQQELVVLPRLTALPFLPSHLRDGKSAGGGRPRRTDSGESYAELRRFRAGDSFKRVHWPASARQRELLIRSYDQPEETAATVLVDTAIALPGEDALRYADLACECAAALAHYNIRAGFRVRLATAEPDRPPEECATPRQFTRLYEKLAFLNFGQGGDFAASVRAFVHRYPDTRALYVLTHRLDDAAAAALAEAARSGCTVHCLLLRPSAGAALPPARPIPGATIRQMAYGADLAAVLGGDALQEEAL